jgi:hypothetical protein
MRGGSLLNKAEEPISRATLKMSWGETLEVTDLDPSEGTTVNYRVREGEYHVEVVFRSGKRLEADGGYVATGADYEDRVTGRAGGRALDDCRRRHASLAGHHRRSDSL